MTVAVMIYYFDVKTSQDELRDVHGIPLGSVEEAEAQAVEVAYALLQDEHHQGENRSARVIVRADAHGPLCCVSMSVQKVASPAEALSAAFPKSEDGKSMETVPGAAPNETFSD